MNVDLTDREVKIVNFALWLMLQDAYGHARRRSEKGGNKAKAEAFFKDAEDIEKLLAKVKV